MAIVKEFIYKNRKNSLAMIFITNYNAANDDNICGFRQYNF